MRYRLLVEGECREVYVVEADSPDSARQLSEDGDAGQPEVAEVTGAEITEVTEVTD